MTFLLTALTLLTSTAHAGDTIHLKLSLTSDAHYAAVSKTSYRLGATTATSAMHIDASINGQAQAQDVPAQTQTTTDGGSGAIDVLDASHIRLTGSDGRAKITMQARIAADGSLRVAGTEMSRAMQLLIKDQLDALKAQLASKGEVDVNISAPDMVCAAAADRSLQCKYGATIALEVSSN